MFTGIVEEIGSVKKMHQANNGYELIIQAKKILSDIKLGDSIAINGACLTVTDYNDYTFTVELSPETIKRTNLSILYANSKVNLERALLPATRMGGHFVQGHIDDTGILKELREDGNAIWVTVQAPQSLIRYIVPKGFISLDGVSLTVVEVIKDFFTVSIVPFTQKNITLLKQSVGYKINIELDILGKYVNKMLMNEHKEDKIITSEFLKNNGYL